MYDDNEEIVQATKYLHSVYPEVMGQIEKFPQYGEIKEILVRLREAIDYTVPHGKKFRGAHIVAHFKLVADPKDLTPENVKLSAVLGWCAEIVGRKLTVNCHLLYKFTITDPSLFLYVGWHYGRLRHSKR